MPLSSVMHPKGQPKPSDGNFQGLLLAAHPGLKDPNFRRSVLFLSNHEASLGAFGFVLNRPLGKNAAELLPEHERRNLLERVPVYLGGPVGHDQLSFACFSMRADGEEDGHFESNLSLDEVAAHLERSPATVRAFVGYAGWSAGQLEGELEQNAWVLVQPSEASLAPCPSDRLWFRVMASLGPNYKLLASVPDDPSLN